MANIKKATTYQEQLDLLKSRGVIIESDNTCIEILENVNYYRLLAYFLPFKTSDDTYAAGTSFLRVYRTYEFDRKLRRVVFTALEEVEVSLRARFAYYHAHKYGPVGYLASINYSDRHDHNRFLDQLHREIDSNKKVLFVKHHLEKYDGIFPVWVAVEIFTFGMVSRFYADMKTEDQKQLATTIFGTTPKNIKSWLRCCSDLRNICAHYGRLYYRIFPAIPAGFSDETSRLQRFWGALLALRGLYTDSEKWNHEVLPAISALIDQYSDSIDLYRLAFPLDWEARLEK